MATEPERPIEKLLRDYATKRREEHAPLDLHPATRRLLQGEVARSLAPGASPRGSLSSAWGRFWPKLAWALLPLLAVMAWLFTAQRNNPGQMAQKDSAPKEAPLGINAPLLSSLSTPSPASPGNQDKPTVLASADTATDVSKLKELSPPSPSTLVAKDNQPSQVELAARSPGFQPVALPPGVQSAPQAPINGLQPLLQAARTDLQVVAFDKLNTDSAARPVGPVLAAQPAAPLAVPGTFAPGAVPVPQPASAPISTVLADARERAVTAAADRSNGVQAYGGAVRRFAGGAPTQAAEARKAAAVQPVLLSFQVEQTGPALRILDNDGSVYTGSLEVAQTNSRPVVADGLGASGARAPSSTPQGKTAASPTRVPNTPNYAFTVAGTNLSLNQRVVFNGFFESTDLQSLPPHSAWSNRAMSASFQEGVKLNLEPLPNSRISGTATIGADQKIEIRAVPAVP